MCTPASQMEGYDFEMKTVQLYHRNGINYYSSFVQYIYGRQLLEIGMKTVPEII